MTLDENRKNELDQAWMESLLHETLRPEPQCEQSRLKALFDKPDFAVAQSASDRDRRFGERVSRWVPIAIAASIAILLGCWSLFFSSDQRAYAAIARGLRPTQANREYAIRIRANSATGMEVTKNAQLYLDSKNRFVVHRRGWLGLGDIWFGDDGGNHWVVPRLGPVIVGSERILGSWLVKKDSTAPYLHIQTILKRMEKGYRLQMLSETRLDGANGPVHCERVRGEIKGRTQQTNSTSLPASIELWADMETGVAQRVVLQWSREPNEAGPIEWTIDLQGFPSLPADWFESAGHSAPGQRIVHLGNESELDSLPRSNDPL